MKNISLRTCLLFLVLLSSSIAQQSYSQSIDDQIPDFTAEEAKQIRKNFGSFTSAVTVFTGRNTAAAGSFSFDDDVGDFSVMSIPASQTFGEDSDKTRFRLRGGVGQFESRYSNDALSNLSDEAGLVIEGSKNQPDFGKDSATSLTLGGSLVYEPSPGLVIEPAFDLIWTHVKSRYDYNNFASVYFAQKFDRDIFNNSTESITYSPSLGILYDIDLCSGYSIIPSVRYTHLWSEDLWSKSQYGNFAIDSGVLQTGLAGKIPLSFTAFGNEPLLQPFVNWTNLNGAAKEALSEDNLYEVGSDIAFPLSKDDNFISQFKVGFAFITASDFSGYRVNLGADL